MVSLYVSVPCLQCGRPARLTAAQARVLPLYPDNRKVIFCGTKCQASFVQVNGQREQQIAMRAHAENLGVAPEDLIR